MKHVFKNMIFTCAAMKFLMLRNYRSASLFRDEGVYLNAERPKLPYFDYVSMVTAPLSNYLLNDTMQKKQSRREANLLR